MKDSNKFKNFALNRRKEWEDMRNAEELEDKRAFISDHKGKPLTWTLEGSQGDKNGRRNNERNFRHDSGRLVKNLPFGIVGRQNGFKGTNNRHYIRVDDKDYPTVPVLAHGIYRAIGNDG
jgi:hypothetical protein